MGGSWLRLAALLALGSLAAALSPAEEGECGGTRPGAARPRAQLPSARLGAAWELDAAGRPQPPPARIPALCGGGGGGGELARRTRAVFAACPCPSAAALLALPKAITNWDAALADPACQATTGVAWSDASPPCGDGTAGSNWRGVTCNAEGQITEL